MNYTAAQIAAALGKTPQAIRQQLRDVNPSCVRVVGGNQTSAWEFPKLPAQMQCSLEALAQQRRYRNAESMLSTPAEIWQPPIPLNELSEVDLQKAHKLRSALLPSLTCRDDIEMTAAQFEASGVRDYTRVFGNAITARRWRDLFKRTLDRDRGAENWQRLEIYLPDKPRSRVEIVSEISSALVRDFGELESFIQAFANPASPTETEIAGVWTLAFEKFSALIQSGNSEKSAARQVRTFLFARAKFLVPSGNRNALRMAFERKLEKWQAANGDAKALRDGRQSNGDRFELPEVDRDALIHRAVFYYRGDIAPAWRDLLRKGFSPAVVDRYAGNAASKSHVPATVRESIAPEVDILTTMHRGPRAFDSIKGHVTRSYDGIASLQCVSGDDFTLNTYFFVPDGKGWFNLTRGQVILFIDFRSLRILGWALEPHKSYSSLTIRSLCTHVFGEFGVPEILYFERGIWKNATLLKGKTDPFTFTEISQGLREFGIKFKHAIRPRTKVVERIGGLFQDIAEAEPGYCGRDERRDAPESLRKQMAEVEARKVHPSKYFYSLDQWNQRIGQLVAQYNADPQQGYILAGISPDQAFEKFIDAHNPPMQFTAAMRYRLAHDKRKVVVSLNGATFRVGKQVWNYRGPEIAHLVGREQLLWFDPENPEVAVFTNLDESNPICVGRSENPNALESLIEPKAGTLGRELARIDGQASYMKTRYNVVKAKFPLPQRQLLAAAQAVELGVEITEQKNRVAETATRRQRQRSQAQHFQQRTGIAMPERAQELVRQDSLRELSDFLDGENNLGPIADATKERIDE